MATAIGRVIDGNMRLNPRNGWNVLLRGGCALLSLTMLAFMAVQYNDPDGLWWMLIYAVPCLWSGMAAFKPARLQGLCARRALLVSLTAALSGTFYYWPDVANWWQKDVWWFIETAREGIGMMIVVFVLLWVYLTVSNSTRTLAMTNPDSQYSA